MLPFLKDVVRACPTLTLPVIVASSVSRRAFASASVNFDHIENAPNAMRCVRCIHMHERARAYFLADLPFAVFLALLLLAVFGLLTDFFVFGAFAVFSALGLRAYLPT